MELQEFLNLVASKRIKLSPSIGKLSWASYNKLADLTKYIEYGCNFDKDGRCSTCADILKSEKCCCKYCYYFIGHLSELPCNKKTLRCIAKLYDEKDGFWRKNKGCILPRKHRSMLCLLYYCHIGKNYDFRAVTLLDATMNRLHVGATEWSATKIDEFCIAFKNAMKPHLLPETKISRLKKLSNTK